MALALYRKYRPATFAEVVGQEHVTEPLRTALAAGRINHAYLFSGPRGCGKTSSARILARSLNCVQGPTPDPCGVCPSCVALAPEGPGSLDVVELDAASHGGVDDTRDLRDKAFYMPAESRYRVFIIDEAHMVSTQGFNALLKIVEEPPEHLVFIFATTEPEKVLTTIRSRTHHYPFRLLPPATLRALLERCCADEGATVEPAVFPLVVRAGGGSARDALSVLDQLLAGAGPEGVTYRNAVALLGVTDAALLDEMVDALAASDGASVFGAIDKVAEAGHDPRRFAADLLQRLRDLVILHAVPDAGAKGLIDAPEDQIAAMTGQAERLGVATLTRLAEVLHAGLTDMRGTTSPRLVLELLCARMLLPAASLSDGALLQRLERVERRLSIADGSGAGAVAGAVHSGAAGEGADRGGPGQTAQSEGPRRPAAPASSAQPGSSAQPVRSAQPIGAAQSAGSADSARSAQPAPSAPDLRLPTRPTLSSRAPAAPGLPATSTLSAPIRPATETAADMATAQQAAEDPADPAAKRVTEPATAPAAGPAARPPAGSSVERPAARPAGQPAAPVSPIGEVDVTDVRRLWAEVLDTVKQHRRTTQILLESATVSAVTQGALILTMPHAGMAHRVTEAGNVEPLRAALKKVLGVDWTIRCESSDATASLPADSGWTGDRSSVPGRGSTTDSGPEPPEDGDIPDDYGLEHDPDAPPALIADPEDAAIELLASQLGARRLEPDA